MMIRLRPIARGLLAAALAVPAGAHAQALAGPHTGTPAPLSLPGPEMVMPWYNGALASIGTVQSCLSDPPLFGTRVMGYAGFSHPPPDLSPAVGEVFYTHLVLAHPGNPCAGSAVAIELILPAGMQTAVSAANPTFCFAILPNPDRLYNLDADVDYGCPTTFPLGLEGLAVRPLRGGLGNSGAWGMHMGFWLELLIPVRATQPQNGSNPIAWRVNPDIAVVGYPQVATFVNGDVIFRDSMENMMLFLDLCTLNPAPQGC
ncbi:MAG: hypothetical protein KIS89_12340 [Dokdonella sp.]|nr:hypothetical protein [Dokdonella sp.]